MPITKADTSRFPRTWVFDTMGYSNVGPLTVTATTANTAIAAAVPFGTPVKVAKVAVSWTAIVGAPSFNLVYNTVQALGSAQAYTQGNVAPMDNSYAAGITTATAGASLVSATPTNLQGLGFGTAGYPNPQLTTTFPAYQQVGGLGVPTNVAVDGQPLFYNDVVLNTTNFPGSGTTGGQGVIVPTNWDAVYPAGIYPYGVGQTAAGNGPALFATDFSAAFTLRLTTTTATQTVTGLAVTIFWAPILGAETVQSTTTTTQPGIFF